jgi:uncharacterized protein (TIGR04255 family)
LSLDLAEPDRLIFERNPLQTVVVQVRFPAIFSLEQPAGVAGFQERIRAAYPKAEGRAQHVSVVVGPGGAAVPGTQPGPWRFLTDDGAWVAAIAPDFVSLETTSYTRFEDFLGRAERIFQAARDEFGLTRRGRVGLRYVNQFRHPDATTASDWRRFLHDNLLGAVGGELLREHVIQALQQIELQLDSGRMTVRHGFIREGDDRSFYLLDIDGFDEGEGAFDVAQLAEMMWQFKTWIWTVFYRSITQELIDYLGPARLDD